MTMLRQMLLLLATLFSGALALTPAPLRATVQSEQRPGTAVDYQVQRLDDASRDLVSRFTATQLALLEKLNRADVAQLRRLDQLVVPTMWLDELQYSPFPLAYPDAVHIPKLLIVDQPWQSFGAYEWGRLKRWGPVSSGRQVSPTPRGLFHLNWRSSGRHSTVNPH
jgi:hypothetical protein